MQRKKQITSTSKLKLIPTPKLSICLNKFYILEQNENYEDFLIELGTKKDVRVSAINSRPTVMLCLQNNAYVLHTIYPEGKTVRVRFRPEEQALRRRPGGKLVKSTFQLLDNILTEKMKLEDIDITIARVFTKAELLVTMTSGATKCFRRYSAFKSKHSIETETSRRSTIYNSVDMLLPQESESFADDEFDTETETSSELQICL